MEKKRLNLKNANNTENYARDQYNLLMEEPDAILDAIGREVKKGNIKSLMQEFLTPDTQQKKPEDVLAQVKAKIAQFRKDPLEEAKVNLDMDKEMVYSNLINEEKRRDLLDLSTLKDLHNEYMIEKKRGVLSRNLKQKKRSKYDDEDSASLMPEVITGSHIRKNLDAYIEGMSKDKSKLKDHTQRHFLQMAIDMNFELGQQLMNRKANLETINYILNFQKDEKKRDVESQEFRYHKMMRKVFLKCSERDHLNNRNVMGFESFFKTVKLLKLHPHSIGYDEIYTQFHNVTQYYEQKLLGLYEFLELMMRVAKIVIETDGVEDISVYENDKEKMRSFFFEKYIENKLSEFIHPNDVKLQSESLRACLTLKKGMLQFLFNHFYDDDKEADIKGTERMLLFDEVLRMLKMIKLFPVKCEKSTARYYYEYCQPDDLGLSFKDFTLFLPMIGLHIVERNLMQRWSKTMKSHTLAENEPTIYKMHEFKLPSELEMTFFDSEEYLTGDLEKLKNIIYKAEAPTIESKKYMHAQVGAKLA